MKAMDSLTTSSTARILTTLTQFPTRHDHRPRRGCLVLRPSRTLRRAPSIVCMAVSTKNPRKKFVLFLFLFFSLGFYLFWWNSGTIFDNEAGVCWEDLERPIGMPEKLWVNCFTVNVYQCICVFQGQSYIFIELVVVLYL